MKIQVTRNNEPILEIYEQKSGGELTDFGAYRNRFPDAGWDQIQGVHMELGGIKEVELTQELKEILVGDLAYFYAEHSDKLIYELKKYEIL